MAKGTILANVFVSGRAVPVEGATVLITRAGSGGAQPELLAILVTDESGRTPSFSIDTPEAAASQSPGGAVGWSDITISAEHPQYERIVVENAQVFPGVQTIQNFQLIPLAAMPEVWNRTEYFTVTPQDL